MKYYSTLLLTILFLISTTNDIQKKRIRNGNFDIVCYVNIKKLKKLEHQKMYYWYKSGNIHNSVANIGGPVLHNTYKKYFRNKQLAEQGEFDNGLKTGIWMTWFKNGNIKNSLYWKKGLKNGFFEEYNTDGKLILSGYYKNNKKVNKWINHQIKDTTFYKGDNTFKTKPRNRLQSYFDRTFPKRDSITKANTKLKRKLKRYQDSIIRSEKKARRKFKKDSIKNSIEN